MSRYLTILTAGLLVSISTQFASPAIAQNEILNKRESGFGLWAGKFFSDHFGVGAAGGSVGMNDVFEIGYQSTFGGDTESDGALTLGLHLPTPYHRSGTSVGGGALLQLVDSYTGFGAQVYARFVNWKFRFVPTMAIVRFSNEGGTSVSAASHFVFRLSRKSFLSITPQYHGWTDERENDLYGVAVGVIIIE